MFIMVISFFAMSASLAASAIAIQAVGSIQASRYIKYTVIIGGIFSFLISWWVIGPVNERGFEAAFTYSLKLAVCAAFSAAALLGAALFLRTIAYLSNRSSSTFLSSPYSFLVAALAGLLVGNGAAAIGLNYLNTMHEPPPPTAMYLDGPATHCVYENIDFYRSRTYANQSFGEPIFRLQKGERIRLEPNYILLGNYQVGRYQLHSSSLSEIIYGRQKLRSLSQVDRNCQLR